jgi:hypothetical protein
MVTVGLRAGFVLGQAAGAHMIDDSEYSAVVKKRGSHAEFVEVGDLSSWEIEPDRAIAGLFSWRAAANKSGKAALKQLLNKLNT